MITIIAGLIALFSIPVYFMMAPQKEPRNLFEEDVKLGNKAYEPILEEVESEETKVAEEVTQEVETKAANTAKEKTVEKTVTVAKSKKTKIRTYKKKVEVGKKVTIKSIIKVNVSGNLNTSKLGTFTKKVKVGKVTYTIKYTVVDTTPPVILGGNVSTTVGKKVNLVNKFLCGDNYDDTPKCKIIGTYDFNTVGKYPLKIKATDASGNSKTVKFTLTVKEKKTSSSSSSSSSSTKKGKPISNYIKKYKNKNTMIGVDVSSWQDEIDWAKAKKAGVEFAIIRIGFGHTNSGEIKMDKQFLNNIRNAKKNKIKVGLYFFSYAENEIQAKQHAEWIIKQLNGEKLDLPIAYDWENWGSFNSYHMSFLRVHNSALTFIKTLEKKGYKGMLYSSAYYLTRLWGANFKYQWLAYYTDKNDYTEKPFFLWQATSSGKVDGIPGFVDIDILYKNKMK